MPSPELVRRSLPMITLPASTRLYRIHRSRLAPLYYGRSADPDVRQRWDDPDAGFGVCYLATEDYIAFAETVLRDLDLQILFDEDLENRSLALVRAVRPLRLVDMSGSSLHRLGADASVVTAAYDCTQAWSAALHAHRDVPDGIRYRARHDDSAFSIALYDRAAASVEVESSHRLSTVHLAGLLSAWCERYQIRLNG